ncbi:hypothetical protein [Piscirickettsia salmonis]|nr:hypothetical protein [Piscirickettsia salmonis]
MGIRESGPFNTLDLDYVGVKSPQFSYSRLKGANPVPHVEMASTGEVACLGEDLNDAFFQSWQATEMSVPEKKIFLSIGGSRKPRLLEEITELHKLGWELYTTAGTHEFLLQNNIPSHCVNKVSEGGEPNATTLIKKRKISLIINLPQGTRSSTSSQVTDGFRLRRLAIDHNIPLVTNLQGAQLILQCLAELHDKEVYAKSWQEFMNN